jgi:hypothetical protein
MLRIFDLSNITTNKKRNVHVHIAFVLQIECDVIDDRLIQIIVDDNKIVVAHTFEQLNMCIM